MPESIPESKPAAPDSTAGQLRPRSFSRVLIANRGEIAVRVIRAAHDEGLTAVAVYAEPDREALHVRMADEAIALGGQSAADSYLVIDKILDAARTAGADAVHPGYGFLSENADFARAVEAAGLVWIGPPAEAIECLGDKVAARQLAQQVGAPLVPGTTEPVADAGQVLAFADAHGLPVAIKAAHGGGGRGIKVARGREEIPELFDSAVREATAAFGRGECFVERFLEAPRHVETQCLADGAGNVVVVSTRDCSLQRRNQKLIEEAPAPFLTPEQNERLYSSSKALLRAAGYRGAGTCEFLIGADGTVSFLEVNTRLQVEHPVSEEVTGLDLVREQFRIARGERLGYDDPQSRGHSIEFRINGEDPARNFMPSPGTLARLRLPAGPGVRVDAGVQEGESVSGAFDSMVAKLIVTGASRRQALERSARALVEMEVLGLPTVLPFHRAVVTDPAFAPDGDAPFSVHTRWIENDFENTLEPWTPDAPGSAGLAEAPEDRHTMTVEVNGKRVELSLPAFLGAPGNGSGSPRAGSRKRRSRTRGAGAAAANGEALVSPMQGTIVKVAAEVGETVAEGDLIVVLEAMKMEQPLTAHRAGVVTDLQAEPGATVTAGALIATIAG